MNTDTTTETAAIESTTPAAPPGSEYVLKTSDAELERLEFQNRLWSSYSIHAFLKAGFTFGQTILDIGCGPGFITGDLLPLLGPTGRIIAIDESQKFLDHLNGTLARGGITNVTTRRADVHQLPVEDAGADGAFIRWVLCYVRSPEQVVRELARVIRPGGAVVIQDYYHYLALTMCPPAPIMETVIRAVSESWKSRGGNPNVGQVLPDLLARHGFEIESATPIIRTATPKDALWQWPATFFVNFLPVLVELNLITRAQMEEWTLMWRERSANPASIFITPPMIEVIARRKR